MMKHPRETLKTLLLNNVPGGDRTTIDVNPILTRIEAEIERFRQTMPMASLVAKGVLRSPPTTSNLFEILFKVMGKIMDDSFSSNLTISGVAESLVDQNALQAHGPDLSHCVDELQQLNIASLGWITFLFSWHKYPLEKYCSISASPSVEQSKLHLENCSRFIGSFIRLFGLLPSPYSK